MDQEQETPPCHLQQPDAATTSPLSGQPLVKSEMRQITATDGQKMLVHDLCRRANSGVQTLKQWPLNVRLVRELSKGTAQSIGSTR